MYVRHSFPVMNLILLLRAQNNRVEVCARQGQACKVVSTTNGHQGAYLFSAPEQHGWNKPKFCFLNFGIS